MKQHGFTIVELMIATTVFSVILLLCTFGILQITRTYYKGITGSKTQEVARTIMDEITQAIKFNGGIIMETPVPAPGAGSTFPFCVGTHRYLAALDRQLTDDLTPGKYQHVLVADNINRSCNIVDKGFDLSVMGALTPGARELMTPGMRLSELSVRRIDPALGLYEVRVGVVSGENDTLNQNSSTPGFHKECGPFRAGSEFCAVAELRTVVQRRLGDSGE